MFGRIKQIAWGALFGTLIATQALGQATLLPNAKQQFFTPQGIPAASGTVDMYVPSTTTRKTTWKSSTETTSNQNTNPVLLDAGGFAVIYGDGQYRQVVKDADGNTIWDAVTASTGGGGGGGGTTVGDGNTVGTILPWAGLTAPTNYLFAYGQAISRTTYPLFFSTVTMPINVICVSGINVLSGIADTQNIRIGAAVEASCIAPGTTVTAVATNSVTVSGNASVSTSVVATFFPYGNGDGSTTFNVPDFRGQTLVGRPNMGGTARGNLTTTYFGTGPNALGASGGSQSHALIINELPASPPASGTTSNSLVVATIMAGAVDGGTSNPTTYRFGNDTGAGPTTNNINPTGTVTVTGNLGGGAAHSIVQPSITMNYIIKVLPDANTTVASGVASLGGMTGTLLCGTGLTCGSQTISLTPLTNTQPYSMPTTYGALCDGTTNDAVALQAWLTNLSTTGTTGYIPPGAACLTNSTLVGGSGTTIIGGGMDVSTLKGGTNAHPVLSFINKTNLNFSDFTIASADSITSWAASSIGAVSIVQDGAAVTAGTGYRFRNIKNYGFNDNYWIYINANTSTLGMSKFEFDNVYVLSAAGDIPTDGTPSNNSNTWLTILSGSAGNGKISDVTVSNINIDGTGLCVGHIFYGNVERYKVQGGRYVNVGATTPGHCVNGFGTTNNSYPIAVYDIHSDGHPPTQGVISGNLIVTPYSAGIYLAGDGDPTHTALSYNDFDALISGNLIYNQSSNSDATLPRAAVALNNSSNVDVIGSKLYGNYGGVSATAQFSGTINISNNDCITGSGSSVGNPTSCIRLQAGAGTTGGADYIVKNNNLVVTGDTSQVVRKFANTGFRYGSIDFSNNTVVADNIGANFDGVFVVRALSANSNRFSGIAATSLLDIGSVTGATVEANGNSFDLNLGTAGTGLIATSSAVSLSNTTFKNRTSGAAFAFSAVGATGTLSGMQFNNVATANQVVATSLGLALPTWSGSSQDSVQNLAAAPSSGVITAGWLNSASGVNWGPVGQLGTSAALSVLGNGTNAAALPTNLTAGSDNQVLRRSGTAVGFGTVANAGLTNSATTVNGQTCTLGSTCTVTAAAGSVTVGTTTIASGTSTRILYDNAGVLGEYTISGSGTVVAMNNAPSITGPTFLTSITATGLVKNADLATMVTNTVKGNATSGTASPTDLPVGTCSTAASALIWTTNTGFGCNTSIAAATVTTNANLTGAVTSVGNATSLGSFSSANLAGALTDETGSGSAVFGTTPTLATPVINGLPTGTGVATANTVSTVVARDASGNFAAGTITAALSGNATSATNATNTGITDDTSTNATMYPTWVTANTGNLPQKTTSTKLTFNPSTGVLSSTSFTGAGTGLTGVPTTALTGTLQAAQEPAHTGDVTNTAGSLALTLVTGNAGNLNSGTLLAARMPALTGDCTTSVGAVATTCTKINNITPGQPYFKVHLAANQSLTSGTRTRINFDTVDLDSGSYWDATNHQFKPLVSGTYGISATFTAAGTFTAGQNIVGNISKNGTVGSGGTSIASCSLITVASAAGGSSCGMPAVIVAMNGSTDTLEVDALMAGTLPAVFGDTTITTYFTAYRIGP